MSITEIEADMARKIIRDFMDLNTDEDFFLSVDRYVKFVSGLFKIMDGNNNKSLAAMFTTDRLKIIKSITMSNTLELFSTSLVGFLSIAMKVVKKIDPGILVYVILPMFGALLRQIIIGLINAQPPSDGQSPNNGQPPSNGQPQRNDEAKQLKEWQKSGVLDVIYFAAFNCIIDGLPIFSAITTKVKEYDLPEDINKSNIISGLGAALTVANYYRWLYILLLQEEGLKRFNTEVIPQQSSLMNADLKFLVSGIHRKIELSAILIAQLNIPMVSGDKFTMNKLPSMAYLSHCFPKSK